MVTKIVDIFLEENASSILAVWSQFVLFIVFLDC